MAAMTPQDPTPPAAPARESPAAAMIAALDARTSALRSHAAEADRLARLPDAVVRELHALRLFRLWIPHRYGGLELPLPDALRVYETAARIDGSIGWAVMIGAGGGLFGATLDPGAAHEIFAPDDAVIAGSGAPTGIAVPVPGGWRVSGRWRWASGAHYATTFTANCALAGEGGPAGADPGRVRAMAFTRAQVTILPTWDTSGMRGTGSCDIEVRDAFVPGNRCFDVSSDAPHEHGPLYRLPFDLLTELPVTAVATGIAAHAVEAFAELAAAKCAPGGAVPLADHPFVRESLDAAGACVRRVRTELYSHAGSAWQAASSGRAPDARELAGVTAACVRGVTELLQHVAALVRSSGMTALSMEHPFARAWRDLQGAAAHASVSPLRLTPPASDPRAAPAAPPPRS